MKKRLLAMMMAIVMVMTLLPTSALAAAGDTDLQEGAVQMCIRDRKLAISKNVIYF